MKRKLNKLLIICLVRMSYTIVRACTPFFHLVHNYRAMFNLYNNKKLFSISMTLTSDRVRCNENTITLHQYKLEYQRAMKCYECEHRQILLVTNHSFVTLHEITRIVKALRTHVSHMELSVGVFVQPMYGTCIKLRQQR